MNSTHQTALVIGGSGMLAEFCEELAKRYKAVGVVGRTQAKMQRLHALRNVVPLHVNYRDSQAFEKTIQKFAADFGAPSLTVAWVHTSAPDAVFIAAKYTTSDFYEITGQSGAEASHVSHQHEKHIKDMGLNYHRIILGHVGDRWLTNKEISQGAGEALSHKQTEYIVGTV